MKLHGEVKNEELENEEVESKNKLMNEDEELKTGVNMFWRNFVLRDSSKVDSRGCLILLREGSGGNLFLNIFAILQGLFPSNDLRNTLNEDVYQLDFRFSKSVGIGNIPRSTSGGRVNPWKFC